MPRDSPTRFVVLGAGPAGLAAAIRLKERGGERVHVRLITQGHLLGGKAATHRDEEGFTWEHGFHVFFGFYRTLWGLLRRAGADLDAAFVRNRGWTHFATEEGFDSFQLSVNPLLTINRFGQSPGITMKDRLSMLRFGANWATQRAADPGIEAIDDICFEAWAADMGLAPAVVNGARFRFTAEAYFNDPHPISAFVTMRSVQLLSADARAGEYFYQRVGLSEGVWKPLAAYFERLGGVIETHTKVVGLAMDDGAISGVQVAAPDPAFHVNGTWPEPIPVLPTTKRWVEDFDGVICTLPRPCLLELDAPKELWERPELAGMSKLRDVVTLTAQAFYDKSLSNKRYGAINGLGAPLPLAVDYQQLGGKWATNPEIRSTMSWVGQLDGFEDRTDETLFNMAIEAAERGGFSGIGDAVPDRWTIERNANSFERFTLSEPGAMRFRPQVDVGVRGLRLAGDWVRNRIDVPCMEGAAVCGFAAADDLLKELR
jgi:uncharacterized protein with NAD-binding domain and iron-sulfur cluster